MIHKLAEKMGNYATRGDESGQTNPEVVTYGVELILQEILMFGIVLLSAWILRVLPVMLVTILSYTVIRAFANGAHAPLRVVCILSYVITMYTSIGLAMILPKLPIWAYVVLFAADLLILLKYAPGDTIERPIVNRGLILRCKILSIVFLTCLFVCSFLLSSHNKDFSNVMVIVSTVACCLTLPIVYKLYRSHRSGEADVESE
ncbi:accessory gene regulator ArgB-like protein [Candidatus Soleaferrea massiliensis]|uniref:accessory gene regulator ArgB-like protein n=1 Tax=Candidatus Soleaferrea massiliensis TaxID=1470354 RepID=UPI00058C4551|nr:accessory gene regulator B family protein [Candidatus Soleaferrea massiliensis]